MTDLQARKRLSNLVSLVETCLDVVRDVLLLAVVNVVASTTPGIIMSLVALGVWGLVLAKYMSRALAAAAEFQPLADRIRNQKLGMVATLAIIAVMPLVLLVSSYVIQSQLWKTIAFVAALGRGA
jgi:hypothetical protein